MASEGDHESEGVTSSPQGGLGEGLAQALALEASLPRLACIDLDKDLECRNELIDDKEFDIPQVDTPPTLESILNETDDEDESFVLEDPTLLNIDTIDTHSYDTSSVASSDSGDRTNLKRKKKLLDSFSLHGSVMRHSLLKGISAQIVSAAVSANLLPLAQGPEVAQGNKKEQNFGLFLPSSIFDHRLIGKVWIE
uniref:VPS8 subunit of CORVET complex n=1 Tax=Monodelphis domestica TaxID=13616 RepID=A0A5F8GRJ4_MONDO